MARLAELETALAAATEAAERAREAERVGGSRAGRRRAVGGHPLAGAARSPTPRSSRVNERLTASESRLREVDAALTEGELAKVRLDEALGVGRQQLAELEAEQESAREARVHWQVQEAHVEARLLGAGERLARAEQIGQEAAGSAANLAGELTQLEGDAAALEAEQVAWREEMAERRVTLLELEAAAADAEESLSVLTEALATAERTVHDDREGLDRSTEEHHRLQLELSEAGAERRRIIERVETEWKRPIDELFEGAPFLDLDLETLEAESARIVAALEAHRRR